MLSNVSLLTCLHDSRYTNTFICVTFNIVFVVEDKTQHHYENNVSEMCFENKRACCHANVTTHFGALCQLAFGLSTFDCR